MRNPTATVLVIATLALALSACGRFSDESDKKASNTSFSGDIKFDGSSTVGPLSKATADLFTDVYPRVKTTVGISGTGGGFTKFCNNEIDIANASRPLIDIEKQECANKGITYTQLMIANDALTVVVNKENTWVEVYEPETAEKDLGTRFPDH